MTRTDYTKRATMEETHEDRECPGCWDGSVYDSEAGAWADHDGCSGTGRALAFLYPKVGRLRECDGCGERVPAREMVEVDHESLTFFAGDMICEACAGDHGVV